MKNLLILGALSCLLLVGYSQSQADMNVSVGFDVFYSSLSPYGEWVQVEMGRVWRPFHVGHGWRPYMHGRWIWSDYGWYWASDEPFGWATFHYGRWSYDDYYGWIWIPDDVWGPAWVEWRNNDDYIGWAPLTPHAHFGVHFTIINTWATPMHYWNFVHCRNFASARIHDYVQPVERTRRFFGSTRSSINIERDGDRVINRGVDVNFIERRGNMRVHRAEVIGSESRIGERVVKDAGRDRIEVYRPRIEGQARGGDRQIDRGRTDQGRIPNDNRALPNRNDQPSERRLQRNPPSPVQNDVPSRGRIQERNQNSNQERPRPNYQRFNQQRQVTPQPGRERIQQTRPRPETPQPAYRPSPRGGTREAAPPRQAPRRDDGRGRQRPGRG